MHSKVVHHIESMSGIRRDSAPAPAPVPPASRPFPTAGSQPHPLVKTHSLIDEPGASGPNHQSNGSAPDGCVTRLANIVETRGPNMRPRYISISRQCVAIREGGRPNAWRRTRDGAPTHAPRIIRRVAPYATLPCGAEKFSYFTGVMDSIKGTTRPFFWFRFKYAPYRLLFPA